MDDLGPEYELHEFIPKDANGDPVFFILPPEIRADYDRKMSTCETGWRETGDPLFAAEAITWVTSFRQVPPPWLDDAVYAVAIKRRTPSQAKAARERAAHVMRYMAVHFAKTRDKKLDGLPISWEAAYAHAEKVTATSWETCRQSYMSVKRDLEAGRGGLYAMPKMQNRKPPIVGVRRKLRARP